MKATLHDDRSRRRALAAEATRRALQSAGVTTINIIGGQGCGKTSLIDATVERLMPEVHVGVIACDAISHLDADRMSRHTEQVVQVNTGEHRALTAQHVRDATQSLDLIWVDLLLIESVGTLVGPGALDVGQDVTVAIFSVAAGDDKAEKHQDLVRGAQIVLLNKIDLLRSVPFDLMRFRADVERLNPHAKLIELSALHGAGVDAWIESLTRLLNQARRRPAPLM